MKRTRHKYTIANNGRAAFVPETYRVPSGIKAMIATSLAATHFAPFPERHWHVLLLHYWVSGGEGWEIGCLDIARLREDITSGKILKKRWIGSKFVEDVSEALHMAKSL